MEVAIWHCISECERQQLMDYQRRSHGRDLRPPGRKPELEKDIARIMTERPRTDFHKVGK